MYHGLIDHRFPRITGFHTTTHKYYMYHRLLEDHRFPRIEFHTSSLKSQRILSTLTHYRASTKSRWWFLGNIFRCTNARAHVDSGAPREGRRGGTFGAGPLSQPLLLSQVNGLSLNSSGGFHNLTVLSENPLARERKLTDVPPQGKLAAHTIHLPMHPRLSPYLPFLLVLFCTRTTVL